VLRVAVRVALIGLFVLLALRRSSGGGVESAFRRVQTRRLSIDAPKARTRWARDQQMRARADVPAPSTARL
jgi:hypothetical protein